MVKKDFVHKGRVFIAFGIFAFAIRRRPTNSSTKKKKKKKLWKIKRRKKKTDDLIKLTLSFFAVCVCIHDALRTLQEYDMYIHTCIAPEVGQNYHIYIYITRTLSREGMENMSFSSKTIRPY